MDRLAAIVGPTASGKSAVAIEVAKMIGAEIISCDSMQIYRGMDIGTAKAGAAERAEIPHHLIDVADPDENYNVSRYQTACQSLIQEINQRGKIPLLVGGTGLYYQAVVDNYCFVPMESRMTVREKWNDLIQQHGLSFAYNNLVNFDPQYAEKIKPQDQKRIVRALEVYELSGDTFSSTQTKEVDYYRLAVVGLYLPRPQLYAAIEDRVDRMLEEGLVEEVSWLREKGCNLSLNSMQALGYKQVMYYLDGLISREQMVNDIKKETRRYAKRQLTWFKKDDRINWIDRSEYSETKKIAENISNRIEGQLRMV
ncbi:MAG: tRNA (adenosine(37)-N6)-dimethylallyltransferase MiaA [Syntrophomonadaceae bacterium]|nr:tRNA (adenosine(37)-N6)-dimethylallyltransferase MiaA [Syntrophomonadaceae bacterium]